LISLSTNKKLIFLCGIGTFLVLNATTTTFTVEYNFPQFPIMAQSPVMVEAQIEQEGHEGEEEPETHREEEDHHGEENGSYSPLSPDKAKTYFSSNKTSTSPNNLSVASLIAQGSPIIGNPNAPITLIEFGDFQCEFCARFAKVTEPHINATYIQTGKANMVFKHFVTHGDDSITAAIGSQC